MRRTTFSLSDDLATALEREARRRHTSASEIARLALANHLGLADGASRTLPFASVGHSGHRTTARQMEELLEQEWDELPGRR